MSIAPPGAQRSAPAARCFSGPPAIILDNASIHTAKSTRRFVRWLGKQGVTLYFLPAYSPELNRIERLWHKIKHTWMAAKCRTAPVLEGDVGHILDHF